jgi:hypothetical protein
VNAVQPALADTPRDGCVIEPAGCKLLEADHPVLQRCSVGGT